MQLARSHEMTDVDAPCSLKSHESTRCCTCCTRCTMPCVTPESTLEHNKVVIVHEHRGEPDGMVVCHLPFGPTAYFGNKLRKSIDLQGSVMFTVLDAPMITNVSMTFGSNIRSWRLGMYRMHDHECMIQLQIHADALQMQAPVITVRCANNVDQCLHVCSFNGEVYRMWCYAMTWQRSRRRCPRCLTKTCCGLW